MEFVEVMRNRKRMCNTIGMCEYCPLSSSNNGTSMICSDVIKTYPEKAEKIIMKWAEEHPIKTNGSKFLEDYPNSNVSGYRNSGEILYIRLDKSKPANEDNNMIEIPAEWWNKEYKEVSKDASCN